MTENGQRALPMVGREQPAREEVAGDPRLTIAENALADAVMARVRDARTGTPDFERLAAELATLALWIAGRDLPLAPATVPNFAGVETPVSRLAERLAGVVILRAGLIFAPPFRRLLPDAPIYQVGIRRDEATLQPKVYTSNLPAHDGWADRVFLLDPMLATGGSTTAAIRLLREHHSGPIDVLALIAAPVGVANVLASDESCRVITVALDERLDERGFIVPGLGDAGDRAFGTLAE